MNRLAGLAVTALLLGACGRDSADRPTLDTTMAYVVTPDLSSEAAPSLDSDVATSPPSDTALGDCVAALRPPADRELTVIGAVRTAYSLEDDLYRRSDSITSWEQVYSHYRLGFAEELARELAEYSWDSRSGTVRATHAAMEVPDSVGVLRLRGDEALVAWIPPTDLRQAWELPRCVVDRVVREGGRWVISGRQP